MASPEQCEPVDKSSDNTSVSMSQMSDASQAHTGHGHSHVLVPESVYNIDEETRMGPDTASDRATPPVSVSALGRDIKEDEEGDKKEDTESASSKQEPPAPCPQTGSSFSALSFIAAQYAESDNSSPRSVNSTAVEEESGSPSVPVEVTNNVNKSAGPEEPVSQSCDGPDTAPADLEPAAAVELEEQKMLMDDTEDSAALPYPSPHQPEEEKNEMAEQLVDVKDTAEEKEPASIVGEEEENVEGTKEELVDLATCPDSIAADNGDSTWQPEPMETDSKEEEKMATKGADMEDLKENMNTMQTMTDISEDSKLVLNMDSVLSSGLDESVDNSSAVKRLSPAIPFGENANSSMPLMGEKSLLEGENSNISFLDESSQSNSMAEKPSRPKRARRSSITDIQDSKAENEDGLQAFPAERVFEYQWPPDGGEWYLLQEQVSEYLAVLSFKRKYPDLTRRTCDKLEKEFLREKGVVTETQSDLGLTAIRSEEVYDLMMKDYPDKYHEYATVLHEREKQKISDTHKEYEVAQPKLEKSKIADYMKKAAKSAADYNRHLLRERREERLACFDLQTFMIHYPEGRYKKLPAEITKPSAYPVALIPGQFQDHFCSYTSDELRYFPLNTVLYNPPKKMQNTLARPTGSSESSSEDSSEDKSGSSSDSSGSGSSDSETVVTVAANSNTAATSVAPAVTATTNTPVESVATPPKKVGKKLGRPPLKNSVKTPGKTPGKGHKRKLEDDGEEKKMMSIATNTAPDPLTNSLAALNKAKAENDEEDKDKCRICNNAVLFLKYKRVETKMIKCSECGKIAHPSCLDLTEKMVQVVTTYPWQCMECKTCVECMDPYDEDKMLFCDRCDRGYHTFCVGLRCLPSGRWECRSCKGVTETTKSSRRGRPIKPT